MAESEEPAALAYIEPMAEDKVTAVPPAPAPSVALPAKPAPVAPPMQSFTKAYPPGSQPTREK